MNNYFYCYSPKLKKELKFIGENYISRGVNPSSNRTYWLFNKTDALLSYLESREKTKNKVDVTKKNPNF